MTRFHEASTGALFGAGELDILHALAAAGRLPARVSVALVDNAARAFAAAPVAPFAGGDMARVTSWKIVADGSNQGRSGYQRAPYLGSDDHGHRNYPTDYLVETIRARWAMHRPSGRALLDPHRRPPGPHGGGRDLALVPHEPRALLG
ncbi:MAG: hypothetical protein ACKORK_02820, partial [Gemmatimonadota bacterium]